MNGHRSRRVGGQVARHVALAVGAVVMLAPFWIMLRTAMLPADKVFAGGPRFGDWTPGNLRAVWDEQPWMHLYRNGIVVTASIYLGQVALCLPAGYVLARHRFAGRRVVMLVVAVCLIVPAQVTALPVFVGLSRMGWTDSIPSLVLPFFGSAFAVFLFRQFVLTIPQSMFDAARLDGVGPMAMVWRVVLPNVRPALVALGVFSIVSHWNDLFWPSVMLRSERAATVPYAIAIYSGNETFSHYGKQMAAALIATVPLIVAFVLAQRQFARGIAFHVNND